MIRELIEDVEARIALLASANLSLNGVADVAQKWEPIMHTLVTIGQFAVAIATVFYIIKKTRVLGKPRRKKSDSPDYL